jgi:predicted aspartyl protease
MFGSIADTCEIGSLIHKTCLIGATEGKKRISGDEDGLIGADVVSDHIVHVDFQKQLLHLTPQPPRPSSPQGYDRVIGPDEKGFTPVFRYGGHLFVSTRVNGKSVGLFLLDTGAGLPTIDSAFARLSTKIRGNEYVRVTGVAGNVKQVFEAEKAVSSSLVTDNKISA